jgi:hypothetical protein
MDKRKLFPRTMRGCKEFKRTQCMLDGDEGCFFMTELE